MSPKEKARRRLDLLNARRRERTLELDEITQLVRDARKRRGVAVELHGGYVANAYGYQAIATVAAAYTTRRGTTYLVVGLATRSRGAGPSYQNGREETRRKYLAAWLRGIRRRAIRFPKGSRA